ncbi:MAG: XisI protein [Spirulinaceae cyanobacterium]
MEKLESYRQIVQDLLTEYASVPISNGEIESHPIFDLQRDHYQVVNIGWDGHRRVYGCVLHLNIRDGKVWVEQNTTEMRVAQELMKRGVAQMEIVLGFQYPDMRQYTDYAIA